MESQKVVKKIATNILAMARGPLVVDECVKNRT